MFSTFEDNFFWLLQHAQFYLKKKTPDSYRICYERGLKINY